MTEQDSAVAKRVTNRLFAAEELYQVSVIDLNVDIQEPVLGDDSIEEEDEEVDEDDL